jgi:uncharacterized protein
MYKRNQLELLKRRMIEKRKFIQCIIGPRQVGKTTLIRQLLEEISIPNYYVSVDEVFENQSYWLEQQWETARKQLHNSDTGELLLIFDEIQKIPEWSTIVKAYWDQDSFQNRNIKVILLGSAQLLIQKGLSESLTGRFEVIPVYHWSYDEMKEAFGFTPEQFAWFGGYPGAADLIENEDRWKFYIRNAMIETTISRDVLSLTRIDKPALLRHVFELSCAYSGQILSFNKMLGQLQDAGNMTTLAHYLDLLDKAGLISGLEKYSGKEITTRNSIPKLQVYNNSLLTVNSRGNFKEIQKYPDIWGRLVESAVGVQLLNASRMDDFKLFYWRDRNDEVDFVIEKDGKTVGIEVKSGRARPPAGIKAFKLRFPDAKIIMTGTAGISWQEFLALKPLDLFS